MARTLISGIWKPLLVKVPGRKPAVIGGVETVFPPRTLVMEPRQPMVVSDTDADFILEAHGKEGIIEYVANGVAGPQTTLDDAVIDAKTKRGQYLETFIDLFRENNALRRAQGNDILLPRQVHREALRELRVLRKELAEVDAELLDAIAPQKRPEDITREELRAFGVTGETMPLTPGVSSDLTGIDLGV